MSGVLGGAIGQVATILLVAKSRTLTDPLSPPGCIPPRLEMYRRVASRFGYRPWVSGPVGMNPVIRNRSPSTVQTPLAIMSLTYQIEPDGLILMSCGMAPLGTGR